MTIRVCIAFEPLGKSCRDSICKELIDRRPIVRATIPYAIDREFGNGCLYKILPLILIHFHAGFCFVMIWVSTLLKADVTSIDINDKFTNNSWKFESSMANTFWDTRRALVRSDIDKQFDNICHFQIAISSDNFFLSFFYLLTNFLPNFNHKRKIYTPGRLWNFIEIEEKFHSEIKSWKSLWHFSLVKR